MEMLLLMVLFVICLGLLVAVGVVIRRLIRKRRRRIR